MRFNGETLKFDRKAKCDWCGKRTLVGITHYGTTHYNRLICEQCATEIKEKDESIGYMHDSMEKFDRSKFNYGKDQKVICAEEAIKMIREGKFEGGNDTEGIYFQIQAHGSETLVAHKGQHKMLSQGTDSTSWGRIWHHGTQVFSDQAKLVVLLDKMVKYLKNYNEAVNSKENKDRIQRKIFDIIMGGCNADLPKNITKLFEENEGSVKVYVTDNGTCIEYEGQIKGKTIKGRILSRSLKSDCIRLAEDIAHFAFGTNYQDSKVKVKDAETDFELSSEGSETWKDYYESRDLNPEDYEDVDDLSTYAATLLYKGQRLCTLKLLNYRGAKSDWSECEIIDPLKPLTQLSLYKVGATTLETEGFGFEKDLKGKALPYCPNEESARKCLLEQIVPQIEEALNKYNKDKDFAFYKKLEKLISKLDNLAEEFGSLIDEAPSKHEEMIKDLYEELLDQVKLNKTVMLYDDPDSHLYEE